MNKKEETPNETSIDELARMVQDGFIELKDEIKKELKKEIKEVKEEIKEVKLDTESIKTDLNKKIDRFEHNELVYRVERLEKKCA